MKGYAKKAINKFLTMSMVLIFVFVFMINGQVKATTLQLSEREKINAELSMKAATEGMVLLENKNNALPIETKGKIALFGGGAYETIKGGTGSGDVNQRYTVSVYEGFKNAGYEVTSEKWIDNYVKLWNEGNANFKKDWMNSFTFPDTEVTDEDINTAKSGTDTAVYVISRISGEGKDRKAEKGDYYLTDTEYNNIKKMSASFKNSIVVLNVGGIIDTSLFKEIEGLDSVLLMSQGGMEGGTALIKVLNGEVTPSGKLTDTWAVNYNDYPSSKTFSSNDGDSKQEDYNEGIYVGYRYFDTFGIAPAYEFGYGSSYTTFDTKVEAVTADKDKVTVKAKVTNTGLKYSGKEVVEVYFSAPKVNIEKPYQELASYVKTDTLAPGQSQIVTISYNTSDMSSYNEKKAAYEMEKGSYYIRVGNSSRNTHVGAVLNLDESVVTEQLSNQLEPDKRINTLTNIGEKPYTYDSEETEIAKAPVIKLLANELNLKDGNNASKYDDEKVTTYVPSTITDEEIGKLSRDGSYKQEIKKVDVKENAKLLDVYNNKITMEQFVAGMSNDELAEIVNGVGMTASEANDQAKKGAAGQTTGKYYEKYGIPEIILTDGPAGIRISQSYEDKDKNKHYQYCTAWPIGSDLAQTWNTDVVKSVGKAIGEEMLEYGMTLWLAPGMNIHKNPLCGRNFEYYSEDPYLTGTMGAAATKGVQSKPGIGVTIKHFASNNQENDRTSENNTVSERALREIYLKGFEIAVKNAKPMAIMTSYNKLNGKYTAANHDLCTDIPRGEWNFKGLIMTDWLSGADPIESMHAGNDLIMPGWDKTSLTSGLTKVIEPQFEKDGYVKVSKAFDFVTFSMKNVESWNNFILDPNGKDTAITKVAAGVELNPSVKETENEGLAEVTTNQDGTKTVTYKGRYDEPKLYLGDLQRSAIRVLNTIMQSTQFKNMHK
ncbi:beta-glucosidase [Clostridium gelidum]|uniref:Beta-glucosidase n=1 Tax=Clostridium gelidum TaxID=704125 RepID=A0ABM7TC97_9CLOT|nr:glycoside hydrolase family 3 protein [Clostridium gelidum]BCZ48953.1 beta-glucosidase [Clostridium gelidum]